LQGTVATLRRGREQDRAQGEWVWCGQDPDGSHMCLGKRNPSGGVRGLIAGLEVTELQ
jgi:hypothetical protein